MLPESISIISQTAHGLAAAVIPDIPKILSLTPQLLPFNAVAITGQLPNLIAIAALIEMLLMIFSLPLRPAKPISFSLTASATTKWFAIAQSRTPLTVSMKALFSIARTLTVSVSHVKGLLSKTANAA